MEQKVSEILENILGLLALEGSFEVVENPEEVNTTIQTTDPGRLIGFRGETLDSLQLIVNLILSRQLGDESKFKQSLQSVPEKSGPDFKRVIIDVEGWRKNKEEDLERRAKSWAKEVLESGKEIALEPMPSWQRRIIHMVISETAGVESESIGEGRDRHLVIRPEVTKKEPVKKVAKKTKKE